MCDKTKLIEIFLWSLEILRGDAVVHRLVRQVEEQWLETEKCNRMYGIHKYQGLKIRMAEIKDRYWYYMIQILYHWQMAT